MKATHSQVQCAATANPISRLKLRAGKTILTSTKNKRGSYENQICSILLLSLKQKLKCRWPRFPKSAFLLSIFSYSILFLFLHIKTGRVVSTIMRSKMILEKSYYLFLKEREFTLTCLQTPCLNLWDTFLPAYHMYLVVLHSVIFLSPINFLGISQMRHIILFSSSIKN